MSCYVVDKKVIDLMVTILLVLIKLQTCFIGWTLTMENCFTDGFTMMHFQSFR